MAMRLCASRRTTKTGSLGARQRALDANRTTKRRAQPGESPGKSLPHSARASSPSFLDFATTGLPWPVCVVAVAKCRGSHQQPH